MNRQRDPEGEGGGVYTDVDIYVYVPFCTGLGWAGWLEANSHFPCQ